MQEHIRKVRELKAQEDLVARVEDLHGKLDRVMAELGIGESPPAEAPAEAPAEDAPAESPAPAEETAPSEVAAEEPPRRRSRQGG